MIYLDHQASTPMSSSVFEKMRPFYTNHYANPHSSEHAGGWKTYESILNSKDILSKFCGCDKDELIFTSGATEANNIAILGVGRGTFSSKRNRILVSAIEHKCVLEASNALARREGIKIEVIPVDKNGAVDIAAMHGMIDDTVRLVSVMAVNNEIGTIQNIISIASVAHQYGALLHCDAAQAPIAVPLSHIFGSADFISLSAHKMYGPKGIGALIIKREHQSKIEPLVYGGAQQDGLRPGTLATPLCVGFAAAAEEISASDFSEKRNSLRRLRKKFVEGLLSSIDGAELNGPALADRHPGNANIQFPHHDGADLLTRLQPNLAASTGAACSSGVIEPSHVLEAIGLSRQQASNSVRFSLGLGTSSDDVKAALELILEAVQSRT